MKPAQIIAYAHAVDGVNCRGDVHGSFCRLICSVIEAATQETLQECAAVAEHLRNQAGGAANQAKATRNQAEMIKHVGAANMAELIRRSILLPAGGCGTCLDKKVVPSTIAPGLMTKCPTCAGQPVEGAVAG